MIELYTWNTSNGRKISIMLEELGIPYVAHAVNLDQGDQHKPEFLAISPNNRVPAIVDRDTGMSLMESESMSNSEGKLKRRMESLEQTRYKNVESKYMNHSVQAMPAKEIGRQYSPLL